MILAIKDVVGVDEGRRKAINEYLDGLVMMSLVSWHCRTKARASLQPVNVVNALVECTSE
jgi:hypothetical protein